MPSFEREEEVTIPIDMRFDLRHNANRYYQKYHKQRRAQSILKEQIAFVRNRSAILNSWKHSWRSPAYQMRWRSGKNWCQGYMKARKSGHPSPRQRKAGPAFHHLRDQRRPGLSGKEQPPERVSDPHAGPARATCGFTQKAITAPMSSAQIPSRKNLFCAPVPCWQPIIQGPLFQQRTGRLLCHPSVEESARFKSGHGDDAKLSDDLHRSGCQGHRSTACRSSDPQIDKRAILTIAPSPHDANRSLTGSCFLPFSCLLATAAGRRSHSRRCRKSIRSAERPSAVHTPAYR